jgi:methanogenic corrinoid protein MtbC1
MADLEDEKLMAAVRQQIEIKVDPLSTLEQCREGIRVVGERFEKGDYYISDLIMSAELLNNVIEILGPTLTKNQNNKSAGKVVFGTVKGDIHNIGKDIVISLLKADGYEVYDMGINVPKETFIEKLKETGASVLGLSGLIPVAYDEMKATIEAIEKEGLRNQVKVMIGGGLINQQVCDYAKADAWGDTATAAVTICRNFIKGA